MKCKSQWIRTHESDVHHERGVSLVEFAMVAPFLLLVIFGAIEFTRLLRVSQLAISLSREMANVGFRACSAEVMETTPVVVPSRGQQCFDNPTGRVQSVENFGRLSVAGAQIYVTAYVLRTDPKNPPYYFTREAMYPDDGDPFHQRTPQGNGTKFWLDPSNNFRLADGSYAYQLTGEYLNAPVNSTPQRAFPEIEAAAARNRVVYIGEAYIPHSSVTNLFTVFFGSLDNWYDVTFF